MITNLIASINPREMLAQAKAAAPAQKLTGIKTFRSNIEDDPATVQLFYNAGNCYKITLVDKQSGVKYRYSVSQNKLTAERKDAQGIRRALPASIEDADIFCRIIDHMVEEKKNVVENGTFLGPLAESVSKIIDSPIQSVNALKTKIIMPSHPAYKNLSGEKDIKAYWIGHKVNIKVFFKSGKVEKIVSNGEDFKSYKFTFYPANGHLAAESKTSGGEYIEQPATVFDANIFRNHIVGAGAKLKDTSGEEALVMAMVLSCVHRQVNELKLEK